MKISVLGQCTAPAIAMALQQLLPSAEIYGYEFAQLKKANLSDSIVEHFASCDIVLTHPVSADWGPLATENLQNELTNLQRLPVLAFTGFHPDCIYVERDRKQFGADMGPYNSAIAAAGFSMGMSVSQTLSLFNRETYNHLGYFEEFEKAETFLGYEFDRCGLPSEEIFQNIRGSIFMHTTNHPRGSLISHVAKWVAEGLGLVQKSARVPELAFDFLAAHPIWPVYPEIADYLGVHGSLLFKKHGSPDAASGLGVLISLDTFVRNSFVAYEKIDPSMFTVPPVARIVDKLKNQAKHLAARSVVLP